MKKTVLVVLLLSSVSLLAQEGVEVFGGYSYLRADVVDSGISDVIPDEFDLGDMNMHGWTGAVNFRITPVFGVVADVSGHYGEIDVNLIGIPELPTSFPIKFSYHNFMAGPRLTLSKGNVRPFVHAMAGVTRRKAEVNFLTLNQSETDTDFIAALGGGVDYQLSDNFGIRVAQVDYMPSRIRFDVGTGDQTDWQHNFRVSTGVVFVFGRP